MTAQANNLRQWTARQAILIACGCLTLGIAGGWFLHPAAATVAAAPAVTAPAAAQGGGQSPEQLKQQADQQAAPLLAKLKNNPADAEILASLGNVYYDIQQFQTAVDYYGRALAIHPDDVSVRTDMGTAYWYMGSANAAMAEFDKALTYAPTNANTLFNRGLVEWQGKHDGASALADWKKLLATTPDYDAKEKVQQMMAEVQKAAPAK